LKPNKTILTEDSAEDNRGQTNFPLKKKIENGKIMKVIPRCR